MFDIGFWELTIIGVVALIVIGPERLPGVARTAGMWFGRMRRFVSSVKADIDKELKAEELQKVLKQQADSSGIHEIFEETKEAFESAGKESKDALDSVANETEYLVKSDRYEQADDAYDGFDDDEPEALETAESSVSKPQNGDDKALESAANSDSKPQEDDNKA